MNPKALEPGEHVDLDSGVTVKRLKNGDQYAVNAPNFGRVVLMASDIEEIAELVE